MPTSYYGVQSGVGLLLRQLPANRPSHVGMVGLGVGTLAAYGRPGDQYRFYEINPDVIRLAHEHFTYLDDSRADVQMVVGDARLSLERETPQDFDVLVLDAFSSDAVPAHLLTTEAFAIYQKHLRTAGVLAFHITNRHFDLEPVIRGAAEQSGWQAVKVRSPAVVGGDAGFCDWMLVARDSQAFCGEELQTAIAGTTQGTGRSIRWTDRYNHVVGVMKSR